MGTQRTNTVHIPEGLFEITQTLGIGYGRSNVAHSARGAVRKEQGLALFLRHPSLCRPVEGGSRD